MAVTITGTTATGIRLGVTILGPSIMLTMARGYYKGEVDGLLGPMTREALTAYQADQGLATTAAIDEPTLDSLGMS